MAEPTFTLRLLSPDGTTEDHDTVALTAPGELGYLGILAHHAPLVTTLAAGRLVWRGPDQQSHQREVPGGLLEVRKNIVTIMTGAIGAPAGGTSR